MRPVLAVAVDAVLKAGHMALGGNTVCAGRYQDLAEGHMPVRRHLTMRVPFIPAW